MILSHSSLMNHSPASLVLRKDFCPLSLPLAKKTAFASPSRSARHLSQGERHDLLRPVSREESLLPSLAHRRAGACSRRNRQNRICQIRQNCKTTRHTVKHFCHLVFQQQSGGSKPPPYDIDFSHFVGDETSLSAMRKISPCGGSKPPPYDKRILSSSQTKQKETVMQMLIRILYKRTAGKPAVLVLKNQCIFAAIFSSSSVCLRTFS